MRSILLFLFLFSFSNTAFAQNKIQSIDILYTMMEMLDEENANVGNDEICRLSQLSNTIYEYSVENKYFTQEQSVEHLLALAWNETRFSFETDHITSNYYGHACGYYQQTDAFSINKYDCRELLYPNNATQEALDQMQSIKERWNGKLDQTICHYFSGNRCGDKASQKYASNHKNARLKAKEYLKKSKNQDHSNVKKVIATCL